MDSIAVIDADFVVYERLLSQLTTTEYSVVHCPDVPEFFEFHRATACLLVLVNLPPRAHNGSAILKKIHQEDPLVAVMFLSPDFELDTVVDLMQTGAFDCLKIPCSDYDLAQRVQANSQRAKEKALLRAIEKEQLAVDIENQQLMNWRTMYANKEVVQTEHLIHEMATTINSSGGYEWLDLLQAKSVGNDLGQVVVPRDIYNRVLESAGSQRKYFDFVTFLSRLDKMAINKVEHSAVQFSSDTQALLRKLLNGLCTTYNRPIKTAFPEYATWISGYVCQDMHLLEQCLRELIVNAIKYSPEGSPIVVGLEVDDRNVMPILNIWVRNQPRQYNAKNNLGERIMGIPHEYSELIFDLFYTIEPLPKKLPEEEWTDGAGLFIARKMFKRQGAWLSTVNGVDYSGLKTEAFIKFNISIPLHSKREFSQCNPKCSPCTFMLIKRSARGIL